MTAAISDQHIFVTGGAGFVGSSLINRLASTNTITVYDNLARNALARLDVRAHPNVSIIEGNVLDAQHMSDSIPRDIDMVVHMAAVAGVESVLKSPVTTFEVNTIGTYNLLTCLRDTGIAARLSRFVAFSTSEVFGIRAFRASEDTTTSLEAVGESRWTYAISKLAAEHVVMGFHQTFGLPTVILRPFNVYGPGQVGEGAIHDFIEQALQDTVLTVHGDGDQIRSWCYIDDMVEGTVLALAQPAAVGEVLNIGNPRATVTVLELARKVLAVTGSDASPRHVPPPYVDVDVRVPRIEKARTLLGFEPAVDLDEGLRNTVDWYRQSDVLPRLHE